MEYYYSKSNNVILPTSTLFLILSWFLHVGFSQQLLMNPRLSLHDMQCVKMLAPCEPYLKRPGTASGTPPDTCCQPLKDMISGDVECLCNMFNSSEMLQTFNATKDDALKLPNSCGLDADVSKCNNGATSSSNNSSSGGTAADKPKSTSSTTMITPWGLVSTFCCTIFSVYGV